MPEPKGPTRKELRAESLKKGRVAEVAGYYRPASLREIKVGPCKIWDSYQDEFRDSECYGEHPNGFAVRARYLAGTNQEIADLGRLRFPLPKPTILRRG